MHWSSTTHHTHPATLARSPNTRMNDHSDLVCQEKTFHEAFLSISIQIAFAGFMRVLRCVPLGGVAGGCNCTGCCVCVCVCVCPDGDTVGHQIWETFESHRISITVHTGLCLAVVTTCAREYPVACILCCNNQLPNLVIASFDRFLTLYTSTVAKKQL